MLDFGAFILVAINGFMDRDLEKMGIVIKTGSERPA
jgi:hypothetical protein